MGDGLGGTLGVSGALGCCLGGMLGATGALTVRRFGRIDRSGRAGGGPGGDACREERAAYSSESP